MRELDELWTWMNSWKQKRSFGGFIIHPIHGVINFSWAKAVPSYTYTPLIRGFKNLYEKTGDEKWLNYLIEAKDYLLSIIDADGLFRFSQFEYAPGSGGLVHLSYPIIGLLEAYEILKDKEMLARCALVIESIISLWWNGKFYSGTWNQDLCLVEALAKYSILSQKERLWQRFGLPVAERSLKYGWNSRTDRKILGGPIVRGVYSQEKSAVYPWYNAFMARSYLHIFEFTREEKWLNQAKSCLHFAFENLTKEGLTHSIQKIDEKWIKIETPRIIVPAFLLLIVAKEISKHTSFVNTAKYEQMLLKEQLPHGGFRNCRGYGIRDVIATLPFNVFAFEYFTMKAKESPELKDFVTYEEKMNKFEVRENENNLSLFYRKKILSVSKKDGKVKKFTLPPNEISGRIYFSYPSIQCDHLHILVVEKHRAIDFGFVDRKGHYFVTPKNGKLVFWYPSYGFLKAKRKNKDLEFGVPRREFKQKIYLTMRRAIYDTPIRDYGYCVLDKIRRHVTQTRW